MCENDKIFAEDAVELLETLAKNAIFDTYANQEKLARLLELNGADALKRIKLTKDKARGGGWPINYDYIGHIKDALFKIADDYSGPAPFIRVANDFLRRRGIVIAGLDNAIDPDLSSRLEEEWRGYLADNEGFVDACDLILTRCDKGRRGGKAMGDGPQGLGSPLAAVLCAVLDEGCTLSDGGGGRIRLEQDGLGPVDLALPDTVEALAGEVLPDRLITSLSSRFNGSQQLAIDAVLSADAGTEPTIMVREYFSGDGGHRFAGMVENCQRVFSAYRDDDLLWQRVANLFRALSKTGSDAASIRESLRVIKLFARNDAPRVLAASILSTLIGVGEHEALRVIVNGRWG